MKRLMLSLVLVAVALLIPASGFAGKPAVEKSCSYHCQSCGAGRVQTCSLCGNVWSCGSCYAGTICIV